MKKLFTIILILICSIINAQNIFRATVVDAKTEESLIGATLILKGTNNGSTADTNGIAILNNIPNGKQTISVSYIGYEQQAYTLEFPTTGLHTIFLVSDNKQIDEILIESTRSTRTIGNSPTRTEILTDEIDEAASMEASKIAHVITHSTGIQLQTTAAASNGKVVSIQGLNGRYTQMLKDGFPLYGGFSASLDVLQIPPLDLRKIEYVKGPSSTLHGGGSISGLINLFTKTAEKDETLLHINVSHIGARDFNSFTSRNFGKWGFTNLASMHLHKAYDPNNDGFSDIAQVSKFNFNPKIFYNPNNKISFYFGSTISKEDRKGGSIYKINNQNSLWLSNPESYFLDHQESSRITTQLFSKYKLTKNNTLTFKNSISSFNRYINIDENISGTSTKFQGNQLNNFNEANFSHNTRKQNLNIGINFIIDEFKETAFIPFALRNQKYQTSGLYINHLIDVSKKLSLESGIRTDHVEASSVYSENGGQTFLLPKINALYKLNSKLYVRIGGGMGYRMPTIFNEESEPYGYKNLEAIDFTNLVAEESYGGNLDFKYQTTFNKENILLTINQVFFYNVIDNPISLIEEHVLDNDIMNIHLKYSQIYDSLFSKGFESQIKLNFGKIKDINI